jgi:hypothetical protein
VDLFGFDIRDKGLAKIRVQYLGRRHIAEIGAWLLMQGRIPLEVAVCQDREYQRLLRRRKVAAFSNVGLTLIASTNSACRLLGPTASRTRLPWAKY